MKSSPDRHEREARRIISEALEDNKYSDDIQWLFDDIVTAFSSHLRSLEAKRRVPSDVDFSKVTEPLVAFGWLITMAEWSGMNILDFDRLWRLSFKGKMLNEAMSKSFKSFAKWKDEIAEEISAQHDLNLNDGSIAGFRKGIEVALAALSEIGEG